MVAIILGDLEVIYVVGGALLSVPLIKLVGGHWPITFSDGSR